MSNRKKIRHPVEEIEALEGARRVIITDPAQAAELRAAGATVYQVHSSELEGTCVGCLMPTDTGLALDGEAEWHIAFLARAAQITDEEALGGLQSMLRSLGWSGGDGEVPDGSFGMAYRTCAACAERAARMEVALYPGPGAPFALRKVVSRHYGSRPVP